MLIKVMQVYKMFILQLKETESSVRSKLINLPPELRGFKFVTTLIIELKKQKVMMQQNISPFILTRKKKQILIKVTQLMHLNRSIIRLYQTYKNILKQAEVGLLIQSQIISQIFQCIINQLVAVTANCQKNQTTLKKGLINI